MSDTHDEHGHGELGDWFRHSTSESDSTQVSHGDFNGYGIGAFLLSVIIVTFVTIVVVVGWLERSIAGREVAVQQGRTSLLAGSYNESVAKWEGELLGDPVWLDEQAVRLPLDSAATQVVRMYSAQR